MRLLLACLLALSLLLAGCAQQGGGEPATEAPAEAPTETEAPTEAATEEIKEWSREGYFTDEADNLVSVTYMEMDDTKGWYVGAMVEEGMYGNFLEQVGNTLHGNIVPDYEEGELIATVSEEGEDGLMFELEGGKTYHLTRYDMQEATIIVHVNIDGDGMIAYAEGEETPEIDPEYPYQSAQINLAEPTVYTLLAKASEGSHFVKWRKDGEDFSTEEQIAVELAESADYVAVFQYDELPDEVCYYNEENGWSACYDPALMECAEGKGIVRFKYLDDPNNQVSFRFVEDKQPEEVLYEVCENWECDMEEIQRTEGFFPGTEEMWACWRVMPVQENGLSRTAIAGEYNGGVLLIENVVYVTGDDEMDYRIAGALEQVVDSLSFDDFGPQTMYDYIPGVYTQESDGAVYSIELREDHTGTLHFQDNVEILWGSIELIGDDFRYEYTIEGDSLLLNMDGEWVEFQRQ